MPFWSQLSFQDPASSTMVQMISFHNHAMMILTVVMSVVTYGLFSVITNKLTCRVILEAQTIEIIWTIVPALALLLMAFPSLRLLYVMEESMSPSLTMKVIGHQWYWSYEYSDFGRNVMFDSYMIPADQTAPNQYRLLDVDHRVVLPMLAELRILVTAADVIHSWTIPALGIKADAIPGRLNQLVTTITRPGIFYGQCSEICGANHSFMPIAMEAVDHETFLKWSDKITAKQSKQ